MNKSEIEGAAQKGAGAIKDVAGKLIGDDKLRAEGLADKVVGSAKIAVGQAKEAVDKVVK